jgi:aminopeptidase N
MKKILLFIGFLFANVLSAQDHLHGSTAEIAASEKRTASKIINFVTNANTANYDVTYHKLEFTVNPNVKFISGIVTTTYTALSSMTNITFDLANELTVTTVKRNGANLTFVQNGNNELVVTLPSVQATGASATLEITYSGVPPNNGFFAFVKSTHAGIPIIWTLSEPFGARDWWPCKQDLNDKIASIDVYITAPSQYVSVSNGLEIGTPVVNGSTKTTHFKHNYPIPAYLIAIAVTNYTVINQTVGTGANQFPIVNYVYPETVDATLTSQLNQTPLIMNFFQNTFEPYPFINEKYGHAQFGWGGGMEHTTVSFMSNFSRSLIAHELAHQWFGNKITCGSWNDIWLNEGFATYCASMVIENFDGQNAFISDKTSMINSITQLTGGTVYLSDTEAQDVNRIFDSRLSYNKGAMVLNMLRFKMGDIAFFQGIKNYLADLNLAYKYAITPNLEAHLSTAYGSSLSEFFNDWVYGAGYPSYTITGQNHAPGKVRFLVSQTQSDPSVSFFEMPVPIRVTLVGGQTVNIILNNTANNQYIIADVPGVMTSFSFDPNKNIISKNNITTLSLENLELSSLAIFPNPASTNLTLQLPENVEIQKTIFTNTLGQKVRETSSIKSWDVSGLANGVYILSIFTNMGEKQLKFVKN